jgi:hypothetical protein
LLREFLATLDGDKREVFVLAELEGLTCREVADALTISPNTASSRLRVARQAFTDYFEHPETLRRARRVCRGARKRPEQPPAGAAERTLALVLFAPQPVKVAGLATLGLGGGKLVLSATLAIVVGVAIAWAPTVMGEPTAVRERAEPDRSTPKLPSQASLPLAPAEPPASLPHAPVEPPILVRAHSRVRAVEPDLPRPTQPDLADYEALRAAREHLLDGHYAAALALLDTIEPRTAAAREAEAATRIATLCRLGDHDRARTSWSQLHDEQPNSAVVEQLREACWSLP